LRFTPILRQPSLPAFCPITAAVDAMAEAGIEERGAIFTRREVVDFILDLAGYTADQDLTRQRLLEPSFGHGDFLLPAIDRLLASWTVQGRPEPVPALARAIQGVELHRASWSHALELVVARLRQEGITAADAETLARAWLLQGDFLLAELDGPFDVVIGNPPYVRQELIADALMAEYRARYATIYDRADIYVPF
ncbi:modification methylase PaeR7I, partial [Amaricoccus sp. HAR-UPW-R2A-40]